MRKCGVKLLSRLTIVPNYVWLALQGVYSPWLTADDAKNECKVMVLGINGDHLLNTIGYHYG